MLAMMEALGGRPLPPNSLSHQVADKMALGSKAGASPKRTRNSNPLAPKFAAEPPDSLGVQLGTTVEALHAPDGDFDVTMGAECNRGSSTLLNETRITSSGLQSVRRCRDSCAATADCVAAEVDQVLGTCKLWRECLYREPAMRFIRAAGPGEAGQADEARDERGAGDAPRRARVGGARPAVGVACERDDRRLELLVPARLAEDGPSRLRRGALTQVRLRRRAPQAPGRPEPRREHAVGRAAAAALHARLAAALPGAQVGQAPLGAPLRDL